MSKKLCISVAMAAYNSERFIAEQLESLARQTRLPDELVISDDCSTDATIGIIRTFEEHSPFPVKLSVNQHNVGMTKNFERAFERCGGDIIMPSDCDDVWLPQKLERVEAEFSRDADLNLVISDSELVDQWLRPLGSTLVRDSPLRPSFRSLTARLDPLGVWTLFPFAGHAMAFRADCRPWFLPIPDSPAFRKGGWDTWVGSIISTSGRWVFLREVLVLYRHHGSQTSGGAELWSKSWLKRRVAENSAGYYFDRAEEARLIYQRLISNGLDQDSRPLRFLRGRCGHFAARARVREAASSRLSIIFRELITLRYYRHSFGFLSAIKDLLLLGEHQSPVPFP